MSRNEAEIWVDRDAERARLHEAMRRRESLLLWGPADAGKSALVEKVLAELHKEKRRACLLANRAKSPRELLQQLVRQMFVSGNAHVQAKASADGAVEMDLERWLRTRSSGSLRGIVYAALKKSNYWIFLDHMPPFSHPMARLAKELIWRCETPVYLLARGCTPDEIGNAWSLYWTEKHRLHVGPLELADATALLSACIRRFGLNRCNVSDFRDELLDLSGRLPGAIVKMCAMAAEPKYQHDGHIKTRLLRVDYLMNRRNDGSHRGQNESVSR